MIRTYPELFILRHGQTEWNAAGRMQGHMDSPLTELGRDQAQAQNRILARLDLPTGTTFHCSPLGRTRATAELALAGLTGTPRYDDRLKEVSVGAFEGLTLQDIQSQWPQVMAEESPLSWHYRAPKGEGFERFRARLQSWLDEQETPAVVVTHGMVSGVLRGIALDLDLDGIARLPGGQGIVYHVRNGIHRRIDA